MKFEIGNLERSRHQRKSVKSSVKETDQIRYRLKIKSTKRPDEDADVRSERPKPKVASGVRARNRDVGSSEKGRTVSRRNKSIEGRLK